MLGFVCGVTWVYDSQKREYQSLIQSPQFQKVRDMHKTMFDIHREKVAKEVAKGDITAAFLKFMAPDGFAPGNFALRRAEYEAQPKQPPPPPGFKLEWEPLYADVSDDGTLGYTWGYAKYTVPVKDGSSAPKISFGMTLSIWKRQADGSWKWVFDGGPAVPREKIPEFLKRTDLPSKPTLLN